MTVTFTEHFRFGIPDFTSSPWHMEFEALVQDIDRALYGALIGVGFTVWANSTVYAIGDTVISPEDGSLWFAQNAHTSALSPTTFTQDRINNPSYWLEFGSGASGGAPTGAEYLVSSAHAALTAERVITNTPTVTWDFSTPGQAKANSAAGGTPGGSNTQIQFNDGGVFGGDADFTWNKLANTLALGSGSIIDWASGDVTLTHSLNTLVIAGATDVSIGIGGNLIVGTIQLGNLNDTTLSRFSAGKMAVENLEVLTSATGQPLDATLSALAAYNSNGFIVQVALDTFTSRMLVGPAAGISVTNGDGLLGNPTIALANDLAALEALAGTNTIYYRSGVDTWAAVSIGSNLTFTGGVLAASSGTATVGDGDYGDIIVTGTGTIWTIDINSVGNTKLTDMASATVKGQIVGGSGDPVDLTATQLLTIIETVDGSGSGLDADLLDGQSSAFYATATSVSDHLSDPTAAHAASAISFTPAGSIAATDLQAAIVELDNEKQPLDADLTSWAAITRATGFDTFVASPTSANLAALVTGETGTGSLVFSNNPVLVAPTLGTPVSGVLTNCTGLPSILVANETTDATCFVAFFTATGPAELGPKTSASFTFNSITSALGVTTIELGNAADTTLSRVSAGVIAVEGVNLLTTASGVPSTRLITAGAGLIGGGDLSADRTLAVGAGTGITVNADDVALTIPVAVSSGGTGQTTEAEAIGELIQALTQDTTPDSANDFLATYDASTDTGRRVSIDNLIIAAEATIEGVIDTLSNLTSATSLSSVGTITTGVWNGTDIAFANIVPATGETKLVGRGQGAGAGDFQEITLGTNISMTGTVINVSSGTATLGDGDYGDIIVSGSGTVLTIDSNVVTYAKMQDVSAASRLLGRGDSGAGDPQEITLGTNLSMSGTTLNAAGGVPTTITVANEAADTTCFPSFFTAATGDLGPKTNSGWTLNSATMAMVLSGVLSLTNATVSTSITTGALVVAGGVGISGKTYVGAGLNVANSGSGTTFSVTGTTSGVAAQINGAAGQSAFVVNGVGANLFIDLGGGGANYIEGTATNFRTEAGTQYCQIIRDAAGGAVVIDNDQATVYAQVLLRDTVTSKSYQFGFGGTASAFANKFFIYNSVKGSILTADEAGQIAIQAATASTSSTTGALVVAGGIGAASIFVSQDIRSTASVSFSAGLGYSGFSASNITQITSKATAVTLATITGTVTMHNASLAANTSVNFLLNSSYFLATDIVLITHISGGTIGAYTVTAQPIANACNVSVRNVTAGALGEAIVLGFMIFRR